MDADNYDENKLIYLRSSAFICGKLKTCSL